MDTPRTQVLFGAAYYHEYQPSPRLKTDLDLMVDAGFSVIRVGESVWTTWEPEEGRFDLDWLQPVLDGAHERGIKVILGTPTYAAPPWLARRYPEIAAETATGTRMPWGGRQEIDYTHPAFRFHAERVIRKIVARYADHPAVIGYQVDNEPGMLVFHNHGVFQRFVDELRHTYGDVETLNEAWGLVYWSHRLSTWADLWTPDGNSQPQYDLAWRRFQAKLTTEFIAWQAGIVREYARADQFVTTCIAYERPAVDDADLTRALDVTAGNPYYAMQDALAVPDARPAAPQGWTTSGAWSLFASADRMFASKQAPFLVTETNAGAIGGPSVNFPAYDGQWRQAAWAFVARGAEMIEYWHWHTNHFGTETYWIGILPHDQQPGRVYARAGPARSRLPGRRVGGRRPDAGRPDRSALLRPRQVGARLPVQLPVAAGGRSVRRHRAWTGGRTTRSSTPSTAARSTPGCRPGCCTTSTWSRPTARPCGSIPPSWPLSCPVLVVPGLLVADNDLLDWLRAYAAAGGHLVLGPRTAYGDEEGRARTEVKPARLVRCRGGALPGVLQPERDAAARGGERRVRVVRRRRRDPVGRRPDRRGRRGAGRLPSTRTSAGSRRWSPRSHGQGRITTVGTVPGRCLRRRPRPVARPRRPLVGAAGLRHRPLGHEPRRTTGPRAAQLELGRRRRSDLPGPLTDLLTEEAAVVDRLDLGPWDVRVLGE